jgi:hypothetical protein
MEAYCHRERAASWRIGQLVAMMVLFFRREKPRIITREDRRDCPLTCLKNGSTEDGVSSGRRLVAQVKAASRKYLPAPKPSTAL